MNAVVALLVAVCISVLAAVALAFSFSGLSPLLAVISLGSGLITGGILYFHLRSRHTLPGKKLTLWDWFVIVSFGLFALRAFCWLVFRNEDDIQIISPNNLGDLALHITYIRNIANGVPFWPDNPIFAGEQIHYPFGIDVFNSLLTLAGVDVYRGLVWVGLASCLITGIAFYKWGRAFALAGFLFNGGLAGFQFFTDLDMADFQTTVAWKSIPLAMFVTQRGLLYAIPAGLVLLCSWRERFFPDKDGKERNPFPLWVEVLLYSTMPLFHLHAFIFFSLLLGCWLIYLLIRRFSGQKATVERILLLLWGVILLCSTKPLVHLNPLIFFLSQFGCWLVWLLLRHFSGQKATVKRYPLLLWGVILLYSWKPLLNLNAIIILSLLLGCWLLWQLVRRFSIRETPELIPIVKLLAWSFVPATVLVAFITGFFKSSSMVHLPSDWMWMYSEQPQFDAWAEDLNIPSFLIGTLGRLACWGVNFGLFPFFIAALIYTLIRNRKSPGVLQAGAFVLPSIAIFIFSLAVMLAPWEWDNTKMLIWPYFVVLPFLWDHLLAKWDVWMRGICCFVLYFSGFVSLFGGIDGSHTGYTIASSSELGGVGAAVRNLPATAIFAALPTYNHPLLLNGRDVVAGYPGHLWSHGIDSKAQIANVDALLNGEPRWRQIARDLHVRYIFWGTQEKKTYQNSTQPWKSECPLIAQGPWGEIYELKASR